MTLNIWDNDDQIFITDCDFFSDQDCGSSTDYVKGVFGTRFVYCYELRDNGPYYFSLPPEEIIPVGLETIDSLAVLIREARNLAYTDTGEDLKVWGIFPEYFFN